MAVGTWACIHVFYVLQYHLNKQLVARYWFNLCCSRLYYAVSLACASNRFFISSFLANFSGC